jgi:sugar lactone lactonase YvrE
VRDRVFPVVRAVVIFALAALVTVLALPSPMRSVAWTPPRAPNLEGAFAPNQALATADRLASGQVVGPESIAVDVAGRLYTGTTDGKIVRMRQGGPVEVFTETGGRPLGMSFAPNGDLYVADVMKGLLRVDPQGNVEVLAHEAEGAPLLFLDDVVVSRDGKTVYFTDASAHWTYGEHVEDLLEANPTGRVVRFDVPTRTSTVLVRGLAFANGIALAPDESFLLVTETSRYRISRVWLTGDKRNMTETLVENLPGFPDNITASPRGTYWVALATVRKPLLDAIHPLPFIKDCIASLPPSLRPRPIPYGLVFEMDANGRVLRSLHDPTGARFRDLTSALEARGDLYLGSLTGTSVGRVPL